MDARTKKLIEVVGRFIDTRSLGSAFIVLSFLIAFGQSQGEKLVEDAVFVVNEPFYFALASDLRKQIGKLNGSQDDMKDEDIDKFVRFCAPTDLFYSRYIAQAPDARFLRGACERLLQLADQRSGI